MMYRKDDIDLLNEMYVYFGFRMWFILIVIIIVVVIMVNNFVLLFWNVSLDEVEFK